MLLQFGGHLFFREDLLLKIIAGRAPVGGEEDELRLLLHL
jgi:hypothetical protein